MRNYHEGQTGTAAQNTLLRSTHRALRYKGFQSCNEFFSALRHRVPYVIVYV